MLHWTTTHNIPTEYVEEFFCGSFIAKSTVVDNTIFFFLTSYKGRPRQAQSELFRFDMNSLKTIKLKCNMPFAPESWIYNIGSHLGTLYIITKNRNKNRKLYTLDIKTMTFAEVRDLGNNVKHRLHVFGNFMYLEGKRNEQYNVILIKINLTNMEIEIIELELKDKYWLFSRNEKLHICFKSWKGWEVYEADEELHKFHKILVLDGKNEPDKVSLRWLQFMATDNIMIAPLSLYKMNENFWLRAIDFGDNQWISGKIENDKNFHKLTLLNFGLVDDTIYSIIRFVKRPITVSDIDINFEIRILELKPKLVDICLLQLVDGLSPKWIHWRMKWIVRKVPIPLRPRFASMIESRYPQTQSLVHRFSGETLMMIVFILFNLIYQIIMWM